MYVELHANNPRYPVGVSFNDNEEQLLDMETAYQLRRELDDVLHALERQAIEQALMIAKGKKKRSGIIWILR